MRVGSYTQDEGGSWAVEPLELDPRDVRCVYDVPTEHEGEGRPLYLYTVETAGGTLMVDTVSRDAILAARD